MTSDELEMTPEDLQRWMANVNTQMLELILTVGAGKPQWYKDAMIAEIQRRASRRRRSLLAMHLALALGEDIGCLDEQDDDFREQIDLLWLEDKMASWNAAKASSPAQTVWYHGTSVENAALIRRNGFAVDTWFARNMESAYKFGGSHIFIVNVTFDNTPLDWQVHSSNFIPASAIAGEVFIQSASSPAANGGESEWASVNESLPKKETPVLILRNGVIRVGERRWEEPTHEDTYEAFWYWDDPHDDGQAWENHEITHWRPLPALPDASQPHIKDVRGKE